VTAANLVIDAMADDVAVLHARLGSLQRDRDVYRQLAHATLDVAAALATANGKLKARCDAQVSEIRALITSTPPRHGHVPAPTYGQPQGQPQRQASSTRTNTSTSTSTSTSTNIKDKHKGNGKEQPQGQGQAQSQGQAQGRWI